MHTSSKHLLASTETMSALAGARPSISSSDEIRAMKYNKLTRWLHAAIALGVTLQLLLSLVMETPRPGRPFDGLEAAAFESHEVIGLFVFGVLLLHWLFLLSGHARLGMEHLFPWFSRQRRDAVTDEVKQQWAQRRLDGTQQISALAGATHGLGLLVTSIMAITGVIVYVGMAENGAMPPAVDFIKETHGFFATFMWIYLVGHAGVGMLHQWLGHRTVSDMFDLRK